jgi:hypothetical protein
MVLLTCCHCANPAAGCPAARILISGAAAMPEAAAPGPTASCPPGSAPVMTPPRRRCPAVRCSRSRAPPRATRPASHADPWRSRTSTRQARSRPGRQRPARHRRFDDRPVIVVGPHRLGSLARRPRFRCLPGCRHGRPAGDGRLPRPRPYVRRAVHTSAAGRFGYDWTDFRVGGLGFFELGEELRSPAHQMACSPRSWPRRPRYRMSRAHWTGRGCSAPCGDWMARAQRRPARASRVRQAPGPGVRTLQMVK